MFQKQFSEEYKKAAEEKGLYFITNWHSEITKAAHDEEKSSHLHLKIGWCGPERVPAISIY
jgi:hypothetical protein